MTQDRRNSNRASVGQISEFRASDRVLGNYQLIIRHGGGGQCSIRCPEAPIAGIARSDQAILAVVFGWSANRNIHLFSPILRHVDI